MKKLLLLLICVCISKIYAQKQVSLIANIEYSKNKFISYPQTAFGVLYRQKQNTYGLAIDNIGTDFQTIFRTNFYHFVGGTAFYYRHLNKKRLSGLYLGASISYTQFTYVYQVKTRYNEEPYYPYWEWCGTGAPIPVQYRQLKAVPAIGYEYYPCNRFSIYAEAGYGILYLRGKTTRDYSYNQVTKYFNETYENFNFKIGVKSVLFHRHKATKCLISPP